MPCRDATHSTASGRRAQRPARARIRFRLRAIVIVATRAAPALIGTYVEALVRSLRVNHTMQVPSIHPSSSSERAPASKFRNGAAQSTGPRMGFSLT